MGKFITKDIVKEKDPIKTKEKNQSILSILFYIIILICIFVALKEFKNRDSIKTIEVKGYTIEPSYNEKIYNYNVTVYKNEIEILCDTKSDIEGCNVTIDLTGKKEYTHIIKLAKFNNYKIYKINIINQTK